MMGTQVWVTGAQERLPRLVAWQPSQFSALLFPGVRFEGPSHDGHLHTHANVGQTWESGQFAGVPTKRLH